MADHPNAAKLRAASEAIEQSGDVMSQMDMVDDDVVWHEIGSDEPLRGKQALIERFSGMPEGAGIKIETHDVLANDDHAIQLVTATATMGDQSLTYTSAEPSITAPDSRSPTPGSRRRVRGRFDARPGQRGVTRPPPRWGRSVDTGCGNPPRADGATAIARGAA